MTGDPRVLAPLQQAFKETDDGRVQQQIVYAWCHETGNYNIYSLIESEIRAWTPPPAEPSIDDLAFGLSIKFAEVTLELEGLKKQHAELIDNITAGFARVERRIRAITHPEPTAPDDPVCAREGCGHVQSEHDGGGCQRISPYCNCHAFHPAPPPAPDLDPVRVEVTQENVAKALEIVGRAFHHPDTFFQYEDDRASFQFAVWVLDRIGAKFSYLKDGGA